MKTQAWRGFAASLVVVCIWSGWVVVSKVGTLSALTIYDITALRYLVAGVVATPIVLYFRAWRGLSLKQTVLVSISAGAPYVLLAYAGFNLAPASHGGILINGLLPLLTVLIGYVWMQQATSSRQWFGAIAILIGLALPVLSTSQHLPEQFWIGDLFYVLAAVCFAFYVQLNRQWQLSPLQILWSISVFSAMTYLPIWWLLLPSGLAQARLDDIMLQALYQGLLPNLVGVMMVAIAVKHIGPASSSAMLSLVPAFGALLSLWYLNEPIGLWAWIGIAILTFGIILTVLKPGARLIPGD